MGYLEEIFQRAEEKFITDAAKLSWLGSFERPERGANKYTKAALDVRNSFISLEAIKIDLPQSKNLRTVKSIQSDANNIEVDELKDEALGLINNRIAVLEGEAQEEKQKFKEAESLKERELAEERLRELAPKSLGGIKSGEVRRGKAVLKSEMFD